MLSRRLKLLPTILPAVCLAGVLYGVAGGSELRIESMGGVRICTRDLNGDPVTFNPARAALVTQRTVVGGLGYTPYTLSSSEKDSRPYYNGIIGDKSDETRTLKNLELDVLGYYPLKVTTAGLYARYDYVSSERKIHNGYFGKVGTNVVYSTCTYDSHRTQLTESRAMRLGILGGAAVGPVYAGLQYERLFPYTNAARYRQEVSNREYTGSLSQDSSWISRNDYEYYGDTFKAGVLFFPVSGVSADITVTPEITAVESRVTDEWMDGLKIWEDDRDAYPVQKRQQVSTEYQAVLRRQTAGNMVYGLMLGYTPAWNDEKLEYSTYSYTNDKEKVQDINIAAGLGFQMDPAFTGEIDLEYVRRTSARDTYGREGDGSITKVSVSDYVEDFMLVRMGFEKWLFKNTFALRFGGGTYFYDYADERDKDLTLARAINSHDVSFNDRDDFFTFGFAWVIRKDILLEYGARGGVYLDHKVAVTCTF